MRYKHDCRQIEAQKEAREAGKKTVEDTCVFHRDAPPCLLS